MPSMDAALILRLRRSESTRLSRDAVGSLPSASGWRTVPVCSYTETLAIKDFLLLFCCCLRVSMNFRRPAGVNAKTTMTIQGLSCCSQVSNNGTLLRSHARKVPGWRCALGSPFCIPDLDDELYLHCYVRDAESRLHSTLTSNLGYPVLPAPDSGPRGCTGPSQHKPTLHKLLVSVPWAF